MGIYCNLLVTLRQNLPNTSPILFTEQIYMDKWIAILIIFLIVSFSIQPVRTQKIYVTKKEKYDYADKHYWIIDNLKTLEDSILKPINRHFQRETDSCFKVYESSGLRLNACGSDHSKGLATDISMRHVPYDVSNWDVFAFARDSLPFDQDIYYNSHVHISYRCEGRKETYRARKGRYRTYYKPLN